MKTLLRRFESLRWRILTIVALAFVATLMTISLSVTYFVRVNEQQAWQVRQREAAHQSVMAVEIFLQQVEYTLKLTGQLNLDYLSTSDDILRNLLDMNPELLEIVRLDSTGKLLAHAHRDSAVLANLFTVPQSTWFQTARDGERYISDIGIAKRGEPYQIIALPGVDGEVVAGRMNMTLLWRAVADIELGESGYSYVIDGSGRIVAHADPEVVLARTSLLDRPELSLPAPQGQDQWLDSYVNFAGQRVVGTKTSLPAAGWTIYTEVAESEARVVSRRAGLVLGSSIVFLGVLALWILAAILQRQLFRPMYALESGARRIGKGELQHQIQDLPGNEIGRVATQFNAMGISLYQREVQLTQKTTALENEVSARLQAEEALRNANEGLEQRVRERTNELATANVHLKTEIAERLRVEATLRQSEEQSRLLFEYAPIGITVTSLAGQILRANKAFCQTLGYSLDKLRQLNVADITHEDDWSSNLQFLENAQEGRADSLQMEKRYIHKEGQIVNALLRVSAVRDDDGHPLYVIGQAVDITEHKRNEALVYRKQKNESLGILAGGVAHDFNNLLTAVLGQTSLALMKLAPDDTASTHIQKAITATEKAAALTQQMLAYSGHGHFEQRTLDLNTIIRDQWFLLQASVPKNIRLLSDLDDTIPQVKGDEGQLQQVFVNVVTNAAEAIGDESGSVEVRSRWIEVDHEFSSRPVYPDEVIQPGSYVRVSVSDTGSGIDEKTKARLFEPFFSTKFTGRGLGLAAVLGILRGHDGGIRVESKVGEGTTVHLFFPAVADPKLSAVLHRTSEASSPQDRTKLKP